MMKKINLFITAIFLVIASLTLVSAIGVSFPHPQNIELKPGESTSFTFQIQSHDFAVKCIPEMQETQGLEITLDKEYALEANQRLNVKGKVQLPSDMNAGNYEAQFCIECSPLGEESGSAVKQKVCNLPVTVVGVNERTRQNIFDAEEQESLLWIILVIVLVILITLIKYITKKRR